MEKDKKIMIRLPAYLHKKIKIESAKTTKSMNLIILEAIKDKLK